MPAMPVTCAGTGRLWSSTAETAAPAIVRKTSAVVWQRMSRHSERDVTLLLLLACVVAVIIALSRRLARYRSRQATPDRGCPLRQIGKSSNLHEVIVSETPHRDRSSLVVAGGQRSWD
jgi:hypothetical protein